MKGLITSAALWLLVSLIYTIQGSSTAAGLSFLAFVYLGFGALRGFGLASGGWVKRTQPTSCPPIHFNCRCVIAPHVEGDKDHG